MRANSAESEAFRTHVLRLLEERGLSIRGLAREAGIALSGLHPMLQGKHDLTISHAAKIAAYFEVPLAELITPAAGQKKRRRKTAAA